MTQLPDAQARLTALDLSRHVLAVAPAGSGKTGLLVQRMLAALATVEEPEQVVAVTFTIKAAAEIRARVVAALADDAAASADAHAQQTAKLARAVREQSRRRGWDLVANPGRLRALTIDALNAQLAAQLPLLSSLGGPSGIAEDPRELYYEAVTRLLAEVEDARLPAEDRAALEAVLRLADNRVDQLLEPLSQLLDRREQWLLELGRMSDAAWQEHEARALAGLVESRLRQLDAQLDDREKAALAAVLSAGSGRSEVLAWAAVLNGWPVPTAQHFESYRQIARCLVTGRGDLRKPAGLTRKQGFVADADYTRGMKALLASFEGRQRLAAAAAAMSALPDPGYPEHLRELQFHLLRALLRLAGHLRVVFAERGRTDFTEVALGAIRALTPDGGYSEALLDADRRIRHLLIDEMQDTSESQIKLLELLTSGWEPGDGRSLFLVGDPQQSIYAFRKAEVRLFLQLMEERRLGELPLDVVRLAANFRSDAQLVEWCNALFKRSFPAGSDPWAGVVAYTPSQAVRPHVGAPPSLQTFAAEDARAEGVAAAAHAAMLVAQHPGDSIAILGRARNHLTATLAELRRLGVAHACQDVDVLGALPAVRDYVGLARALWHPEDRLAWAQLLRAPFVGLSWSDLVAMSRERAARPWPERLQMALAENRLSPEGALRGERLRQAIDAIGDPRTDLADRAEALWHALGGPAAVSGDELRDVRTAMRLLRAQAGGFTDPERFERGLSELFGSPRAGAVDVLTVHKAKGLEFDHVLLVGAGRVTRGEDKPLLHFRTLPDGALLVPRPGDALAAGDPAHRLFDYVHELHCESRAHEGLRLLYVAATRAKRSLSIFAGVDSDEAGNARARPGSFAHWLLPLLPAPPPATPSTVTSGDTPRAPRLPADFRLAPDDAAHYRPRERRTLKPSEAVLSAMATRRFEGDPYAQLLGSMVHQALRKIADEGVARWSDGGIGRRAAIAAGLRRMGMPEPLVEGAVERVLQLLARVLASDRGRWLLAEKPWGRSEFALSGHRDGRWVAAVIDRCFDDADGTTWLVDYKVAARPVEPAALDRYVAAATQDYAPQLRVYAELLGELRGGKGAVRSAIYFVEADRLVETAGETRPPASGQLGLFPAGG